MKTRIAIYLAGSIKKGHETHESFWSDADIEFLKKAIDKYEVAFLNPAFRTDDLSDQHSVLGRDMLQVFSCNAVFVDARDKRGLGVGAEMMWAKVNRVPVVTWAPKDTHYNKSHTTILGVPVKDFIHPFVEGLSDHIVETLAEGAEWIEKVISNPSSVKIKNLDHISSAMQHYRAKLLPKDVPMKQILSIEDNLQKRMNRPHPQVIEKATV